MIELFVYLPVTKFSYVKWKSKKCYLSYLFAYNCKKYASHNMIYFLIFFLDISLFLILLSSSKQIDFSLQAFDKSEYYLYTFDQLELCIWNERIKKHYVSCHYFLFTFAKAYFIWNAMFLKCSLWKKSISILSII